MRAKIKSQIWPKRKPLLLSPFFIPPSPGSLACNFAKPLRAQFFFARWPALTPTKLSQCDRCRILPMHQRFACGNLYDSKGILREVTLAFPLKHHDHMMPQATRLIYGARFQNSPLPRFLPL